MKVITTERNVMDKKKQSKHIAAYHYSLNRLCAQHTESDGKHNIIETTKPVPSSHTAVHTHTQQAYVIRHYTQLDLQ